MDGTPPRPSTWIDGHIVAAGEPIASGLDHGLLMGDGVFEALVVREGRPVMLERHLRRLRRGLDRLDITGAPDDDTLRRAIDELIGQCGLDEARVRITATAGDGPTSRARGPRPLVFITIDRLAPGPTTTSLTIVPWVRNERSPLAGIKSTAWSENAFALRHARSRGFDNALFLDSTGRLSECATANIFLVIDDEIVTPSLASGCLAGTVRQAPLEHDVAREGDLRIEHLETADAVFITTSTTGVVPVTRIDDHRFPSASVAIDSARAAIRGD